MMCVGGLEVEIAGFLRIRQVHDPARGPFPRGCQEGHGRIRESLAERRFPNRLRARGWFSGHLATVGHDKPVWKPALRRSTKNSRMRRNPSSQLQTEFRHLF